MSANANAGNGPDEKPEPGAAYDAMKAKEEARSQRHREGSHGNDQGWTSTGTILSGIIVYGAIGYGLKAWTGWTGWLPIFILLGAALGVYMVTKQAGNPPPLMDISKAQDGRSTLGSPPARRPDKGHIENPEN